MIEKSKANGGLAEKHRVRDIRMIGMLCSDTDQKSPPLSVVC